MNKKFEDDFRLKKHPTNIRAMLSIDRKLHVRLKIKAAEQNRSIYELTDESIAVYLDDCDHGK
jgi:predicted HicB family RNase H-like nuclease